MLKNLKIKDQFLLLTFLATVAFLSMVIVILILGKQNKTLVTQIEKSYYPSLELSMDLEKTLTSIQGSFVDAVAAAEMDSLEEAAALAGSFLKIVKDERKISIIEWEGLSHFVLEFQAYYNLARKTSVGMIKGQKDKKLNAAWKLVKIKYNRLRQKLESNTNRAKGNMANVFTSTRGNYMKSMNTIAIVSILCISLLGGLSIFLTRLMTKPLKEVVRVANELSKGNIDIELEVKSKNEIGDLARVFSSLIDTTKDLTKASHAIGEGDYSVPVNVRSEQDILGNTLSKMKDNLLTQSWLKNGLADLNDKMRGDLDVVTLSQNIITYLVPLLNAQVGAIYLRQEKTSSPNSEVIMLKMVASYAYTKRKNLSNEYKIGEGLVGQTALEKKSIVITNVPDDYIRINSGLGEGSPRNILVTPFLYEGEVEGVLELGSFHQFKDMHMEFLTQVVENIAISLNSAQAQVRMKALLEKTQQQSEELQEQQEELKQTNEELEEQAEALKETQASLETQQEELRQTNAELEQQARNLELQSDRVKKKNIELDKARKEIEVKANDLELSNKYKSEFMAKMSHELRTPLNSLLILSKLLAQNREDNLTSKQVEFAKTIHTAGSDLLSLINNILDLSKLEVGELKIVVEKVKIKDLANDLDLYFRHVAKEQGLKFKIKLSDDVPSTIRMDRQRVQQIVKNLLANALKFTEKGSVTLSIYRPSGDVSLTKKDLKPEEALAMAVSDTGIGISEEHQELIFEAFQQVDAGTTRKYEGTGLGLSISKELANLVGGEIQIQSKEGKGSTFTLYLPLSADGAEDMTNLEDDHKEQESEKPSPKISKRSSKDKSQDDRNDISPTDRSILIIEDDLKFASVMSGLTREKGFKCLIAEDGETGIQLAHQYKVSAIMLDITLPGMDGWAVLKKLKENPATRHIPVHIMSASDKTHEAMRMGAIGFISKPVSMEELENAFAKIEETISKTVKNLLVVEDDESQQKSILKLIGNGRDVKTTAVGTAEDAFKELQSNDFDLMILDLGLSDMSGFELLDKIKSNSTISELPIIIYTGKELTKKEEAKLGKYTQSIIIKGPKSPERLLDETTLFLHRVEANLPEEQKKMLEGVHDKDAVLRDKNILLVDDDMRNLFAMSSILEDCGMNMFTGKNGKEGLECLDKNPDIDLVLMDIMMPEMDGYEAMAKIRKQEKFKKLPIIALTAKAMKDDRNKCIEAGASDYLSKPIVTDRLLSLLRVWLYQ